jgi:hypothetical protein
MPTTKFQEFMFGVMMATTMVYGMEVYNAILRHGQFAMALLLLELRDFIILTTAAFVLQACIGVPLAKRLTFRIVSPKQARPFTIRTVMVVCTVFSMCPLMSLVATIYFKGLLHHLMHAWLYATLFNLPMAFGFQLLIAGPLVRFLFQKIFSVRGQPLLQAQQPHK